MAGRSGFEVTGLSQVVRGLKEIGLQVDDLKDAFASIASEAADVMQGFAPKRRGALAGSIRGNRAQSKAVVTAGRARVPYAGPINYGWSSRNIRPADFTGRTDAVMRPKAIQRLEAEINESIRKQGLA